MRYHLFLHYGRFLQNLGKDFIRTNMHTTVVEKLFVIHYLRKINYTFYKWHILLTFSCWSCFLKLWPIFVGPRFVNSQYTPFSLKHIHFFDKIKLKPFQNNKCQKNLRYPTKKQSFSLERDCFFVGYLKFFWPFLFWNGFNNLLLVRNFRTHLNLVRRHPPPLYVCWHSSRGQEQK